MSKIFYCIQLKAFFLKNNLQKNVSTSLQITETSILRYDTCLSDSPRVCKQQKNAGH